MLELREHQKEAIEKMHNGCILAGGVGTGKSITALSYYYTKVCDGKISPYRFATKMKDLYIITTAKKRDSFDWEKEMSPFLLDKNGASPYDITVVVDSWNNIKKYTKVTGAFFIFDEQRVVGSGAWVKSFLNITRKNKWILLSATPGDTWSDYIPVFIANGFYKNRTDFIGQHVIYKKGPTYPVIDRYVGEKKLEKNRSKILVDMPYKRDTVRYRQKCLVDYDKVQYRLIQKDRWDPWENKPIENPAQLCYSLRKCVNSDPSRAEAVCNIYRGHKEVPFIIFYNYDYELDILISLCKRKRIPFAQLNGHKHENMPEKGFYLVQYAAGAEAWNCISTNRMIFYSLNYSYKVLEQCEGRIDRLNTPYDSLYYYNLSSTSKIDIAIQAAIKSKKIFNEKAFSSK